MTDVKIHGCPICGYDYDGWSLLAQFGHATSHPWWKRWLLRRQTGLPLGELLAYRKYRTRP